MAIIMEDGKDGETGEWDLAYDGITLAAGDSTIDGFLDPDGRLVLGKNRGAPRFTRKGMDPGNNPGPTAESADTPEQVARAFMEAAYSGDVERALSMLGGPLGKVPDQVVNSIRVHQVLADEDAQAPEPVDWHKEGTYAAARLAPHSVGQPIKIFLILERLSEGWKVVGTGVSKRGSSSADVLRTFKRFRLVDRSSRNAVAQAFIAAVDHQDFELAAMLAWAPMSIDPDSLASEFWAPSGKHPRVFPQSSLGGSKRARMP